MSDSLAPSGAATSTPERSYQPYGWYRVFYAACIAVMSALTIESAVDMRDHHTWLAVLEIAGAVLLLPRRTQRVGLILLLGVFAIASALTAHAGRSPVGFVLFAGTAVLVAQLGGHTFR